MFFGELAKYTGSSDPVIQLYNDIGVEGFTLLVEYAQTFQLNTILEIVPMDREDIGDIVKRVIEKRLNEMSSNVSLSTQEF